MMKSYVLITPARNEGDFIEKTIISVINQTILPKKWIVVSDGSTDGTDEIISRYEKKYSFIKLIRTSNDKLRNFGSKVAAFNYGYGNLGNVQYDFIGNLDGDIGLDPDYYEKVFQKFAVNPKLGIAGGVRRDLVNGDFKYIYSARYSVAGALQLFRRECFEQIGGYMPMKYGGIDAVAETMARMYGWQVESFTDIIAYHYRPTGTAVNNLIKLNFRAGIKNYLIGYHPIFFLLRTISQTFKKPVILGAFLSLSGFVYASICRLKKPVPEEFVSFIRAEQKSRLKILN